MKREHISQAEDQEGHCKIVGENTDCRYCSGGLNETNAKPEENLQRVSQSQY